MIVPSPEHRSRPAALGASCRARSRVSSAALAEPEVHDERRRVSDALAGALAALSPGPRAVLALTIMGGLAPAAIARSLGLSVETVGRLLEDGLSLVVSQLAL